MTSANPTSENAIRPAENQLEESESDILAKEFNDSEVEWHEINEWPLDSAVIVGEIDSTVKEEPPGTHKQIEQLERLAKLRLEGHLTEDEYNTLKVKLLNV